MKAYLIISKVMGAFFIFLGIISVISGIMLITTNGLGMPIEFLDNTPFDSYTIPGIILAVLIGGMCLFSALLLFMKKYFAIISSAALGFAFLIWIFVEMYLIKESFWLQTAVFIVAILILIASMALLKLSNNKNS